MNSEQQMILYKSRCAMSSDIPIKQNWLNQSIGLWYQSGGDNILGLNFDHLNSDSVVMELGAYHGAWTKGIYDKYKCTVYAYEPVESCYDKCAEVVGNCDKVYLMDYGLSDKTETTTIYLDNDGSSMTKVSDQTSTIEVVDVLEELEEIGTDIDLMHVNIEGKEYSLLNHILDSGKMGTIKTLLVQFHYDRGREDYIDRQEIQRKLTDTHDIVFNYEFVWERWDIRNRY